MLTVSASAALFEPIAVKPDAGGGGDGFAPLITGLLGPAGVDGKPLPPGGGTVPERQPVTAFETDMPAILIAAGGTGGSEPVPVPATTETVSPPSRFVVSTADDLEDSAPPPKAVGAGRGALLTAAAPSVLSVSPQPGRKAESVRRFATPEAGMSTSPDDGEEDAPTGGAAIAAAPPSLQPLVLPTVQVFADAPAPTPGEATPALAPGMASGDRPVVASLPAMAARQGGENPAQGRDDEGQAAVPASLATPIAVLASSPARPARALVAASVVGTATLSPPPTATVRTAAPELPTSPRVVIASSAVPVILPALQAFGAAMRQALAEERKPARKDGLVEPPLTGVTPTAVAAQPLAAGGATLDTADRRWPHAMAEQIERLRDAADAQSTRIRLLPDALGPVDVSVRRDGEQVHVHFTAAQAETRQLLADAQPRLADAAEARGLKLGRTDVGGGDLTGDRQQQRPTAQHPHPQPSRPAPARVRATVPDDTNARLA